jgi:Golgi nucleoside diphosphatase
MQSDSFMNKDNSIQTKYTRNILDFCKFQLPSSIWMGKEETYGNDAISSIMNELSIF